jgi:hypothetical protein
MILYSLVTDLGLEFGAVVAELEVVGFTLFAGAGVSARLACLAYFILLQLDRRRCHIYLVGELA